MLTDERTNDQISAALAERLFDIRICQDCAQAGDPHTVNRAEVIEPFASDCNTALGLVVPEMAKRGYNFGCGKSHRDWWAVFERPLYGYADELPRAICLAAEAALDTEEE